MFIDHPTRKSSATPSASFGKGRRQAGVVNNGAEPCACAATAKAESQTPAPEEPRPQRSKLRLSTRSPHAKADERGAIDYHSAHTHAEDIRSGLPASGFPTKRRNDARRAQTKTQGKCAQIFEYKKQTVRHQYKSASVTRVKTAKRFTRATTSISKTINLEITVMFQGMTKSVSVFWDIEIQTSTVL